MPLKVFSEDWIVKEKAGSNSKSQALKIIPATQNKKNFWNPMKETWNNSIYPPRKENWRLLTGPETLFEQKCEIGLL